MKLTMNTYTHPELLPTAEVVTGLKGFALSSEPHSQKSDAEGLSQSQPVAHEENLDAQESPMNTGLSRDLTLPVALSPESGNGARYSVWNAGPSDVDLQSPERNLSSLQDVL